MTEIPDEWPSDPPEPTDRHPPAVTSQLPVRKCIYCGEVIDQRDRDDDEFPYLDHLNTCPDSEDAIHVRTTNDFYVVVPEQTGYVWGHQVGGFACRNVAIQGTLIPIGAVIERTYSLADDVHSEVDEEMFAAFDDPETAKEHYLRGLSDSLDHEYGGIDLGKKLVAETLDGVYTDDEDERDRKFETRAERINSVWDRIDAELPFTYERVAAPYGRPGTQEGLRWADITGQQYDDIFLQEDWIDALTERDDPVALYYPNSD